MSAKIVEDRQAGQPGGIAFAEMSTQWEARRTASMLNRRFHEEIFAGERGKEKPRTSRGIVTKI
jgi:hypothetical protein